jgi:hypothetical protein
MVSFAFVLSVCRLIAVHHRLSITVLFADLIAAVIVVMVVPATVRQDDATTESAA